MVDQSHKQVIVCPELLGCTRVSLEADVAFRILN